jgi:hypothetical protein
MSLSEEGWIFDGNAEIRAKLERGQSFGLTKSEYYNVVTCGLSAEKYAGIAPSELRTVPDGEVGCVLTLWGKQLAYTVTYKPRIRFLGLTVQPMEPPGAEREVLTLEEDSLAWTRVINGMIKLEGVAPGWRPISYEQVVQWNQEQNELGWPGGSI